MRADRALLWARCSGPGALPLEVERAGATAGDQLDAAPAVEVGAHDDFVGKRLVTGLAPGTAYVARARCTAHEDGGASGADAVANFCTAPLPDDPTPVPFAWSADLGGQNVCHDRGDGYPIFDHVRAVAPDFFVALRHDLRRQPVPRRRPLRQRAGARSCAAPGPRVVPGPLSAYERAAPPFRRLLATVPWPMRDDHEVRNDFRPLDDVTRTPPLASAVHLLPVVREAFVEWNPLPHPDAGDGCFYRSARWRKHLELFFLDARSHRDADSAANSDAAPERLLGEAACVAARRRPRVGRDVAGVREQRRWPPEDPTLETRSRATTGRWASSASWFSRCAGCAPPGCEAGLHHHRHALQQRSRG